MEHPDEQIWDNLDSLRQQYCSAAYPDTAELWLQSLSASQQDRYLLVFLEHDFQEREDA